MHRAAAVLIFLVGGCAPGGLPPDEQFVGGSPDFGHPPGADLAIAGGDLAISHDGGGGGGGGGSGGSGGGGGGGGGGGLFAEPFRTIALPTGWSPKSVAIADVTDDGRADIVVGAAASDSSTKMALIVFAQTADGDLAPPAVFAAGSGGAPAPTMLATADFDDDSRIDVAATSYNDQYLLLQSYAGAFATPRLLDSSSAGEESQVLAAGDFDGDGKSDLVAAAWATDSIDVWYQAEALGSAHAVACPHAGGESIAVRDLDGDGAADIAISSYEGSTICVLLQRAGGFAPAVTLTTTENPPPEFLAAGDVDGDGRADLVIVSGLHHAGQYLDILHQNADGSFSRTQSLDTDYYPNGVIVADVDGDARLDVVVPHYPMLVVGVYLQRADGTLAPEETYAYAPSELDPDGQQVTAVGDVNGDGKPDVVSIATSMSILYHR